MKILLINPNSESRKLSGKIGRFVVPAPPVGIAYLAAVLKQAEFEVKVLDQFAKNMTNEELLEEIKKYKPRIIGFSVLTPAIKNTVVIIDMVRNYDKNILIVLGNMHSSIYADSILKEGNADVIVRGEGEMSMLELAKAVQAQRNWDRIRGISYRYGGKVYHNPDAELIEDINALPFPAWDLFDISDYNKGSPMIALYGEGVPVLSSRGCPFRCTFCAQDRMYDRSRFRTDESILDEMEYFSSEGRIKYFVLSGPYFPFSEKQGIDFCEKLISRGLHKKIVWFTETRVDLVTEKLLLMMKKAGLRLIMYGFESGNQDMLDSMKKDITLEQSRRAMLYTKKADVLTLGLFIVGMQGETTKSVLETIKFAKELDCDIVKFNLAVPYPGSQFFDDYRQKLNLDDNFEKFTSWYNWEPGTGELIFVPDGMTSKELAMLQKKAMFEFYMRPKLILRHIFKGITSIENLFIGGYILICNFIKNRFFSKKNET